LNRRALILGLWAAPIVAAPGAALAETNTPIVDETLLRQFITWPDEWGPPTVIGFRRIAPDWVHIETVKWPLGPTFRDCAFEIPAGAK
jgi:hypothetical protein